MGCNMLDAQTQTQMTGKRIDTVLKELGRLQQAKYSRTYQKKKLANKRMVDQVGKRIAKHIKSPVQKTVSPEGKGDGEEPSGVKEDPYQVISAH